MWDHFPANFAFAETDASCGCVLCFEWVSVWILLQDIRSNETVATGLRVYLEEYYCFNRELFFVFQGFKVTVEKEELVE